MRSWLAAAVLAVVAIVLATVLAVVVTDADRRPGGESPSALLERAVTDLDGDAGGPLSAQHRAVLAAAREQTLAFLDVDHRDMGPRIDAVLQGATGELAARYTTRRQQLIRAARQNRSVSRGRVVAIGVDDLDADSGVVLVAADSEVRSVATQGALEPRSYRLQLDMVLEDGAWKTAQVRFVG